MGCNTDTDDGSGSSNSSGDDNNGNNPSIDRSALFCNENYTIVILEDIPANTSRSISSRSAYNINNLHYKIEKKGYGQISKGIVSISEDDQFIFSSEKGKIFNASISEYNNKKRLGFHSAIQTDINTTENIAQINEATVYISSDNIEFPYFIKITENAFEAGYLDDSGNIVFLRSQASTMSIDT